MLADSSRPGLGNPLLPARIFAPIFALAAPGFLLASIGVGLSAIPIESTVLARVQSGTLALPDPPAQDVTLYGVDGAGSSPARPECELRTDLRSYVRSEFGSRGRTRDVDGRPFSRLGSIKNGWEAGDVVVCENIVELVAVTSGPGRRLAVAGLCAVTGVGAALMALIGYRSRQGVARRAAAASGGAAGAS